MRVGTYNGGGDKQPARYLSFPLADRSSGKTIESASLSLYETWSWSCTAQPLTAPYGASAAVAAANTNVVDTKPAQGTDPVRAADGGEGVLLVVRGRGGPQRGCARARRSTWSARDREPGRDPDLRASESDNYGWKKFGSLESSTDPYITFTYNRAPNAPSTPTVSHSALYTPPGSSTATLFTSDAAPTFTSTVSDPDANNVRLQAEVYTDNQGSPGALVGTVCTGTTYTAPGPVSCHYGTLTDNTTYQVRTRAQDDQGAYGAWSAWTTFVTALGATPAPTVTCDPPYTTSGMWTSQPPATDVSCTITAAGTGGAVPGWIRYAVDGASPTTTVITPSADPQVAKVTVTVPASQGGHRVQARAVSRAQQSSTETDFALG